MRVELAQDLIATEDGRRAEEILRKCVHCGFCNATCPTYNLLGDELDGPRGRIYLIKGMFESDEVDENARLHLDRCLTCRNCETTCPSGVEYGELLELGRKSPAVDRSFPSSSSIHGETWVLGSVVGTGTFEAHASASSVNSNRAGRYRCFGHVIARLCSTCDDAGSQSTHRSLIARAKCSGEPTIVRTMLRWIAFTSRSSRSSHAAYDSKR